MTNTLENKAKFFAQYWGQKVFFDLVSETIVENVYEFWSGTIRLAELDYLTLKPLSSITAEDLQAIGFSLSPPVVKFTPDSYKCHWVALFGQEGYLTLKDFDYLRSKGYALPWMGLSVGKQIEYGWVKLATS